MDLAKLTILDVGHGNCALMEHGQESIVVDAGLGSTLVEYLEQIGKRELSLLVVSHADADHLAGAGHLLVQENIHVGKVQINADPRTGQLWTDFRTTIKDARLRGTSVVAELTTGSSPLLANELIVEVLFPTPEIALATAGGRDLEGRRLNANRMSAVIRFLLRGRGFALLPGDLDAVGLELLLREDRSLTAEILVFPHHGGHPGTDNITDFAKSLCDAVKPSVVVFSLGRGRFGTPLPAIVQGIRASAPKARIVCTQLSENCSAAVGAAATHLLGIPAAGRRRGSCCGGSLEFEARADSSSSLPEEEAHSKWIVVNAPTSLCLKQFPPT